MYKEIRRKRQALGKDESLAILHNHNYGVLATVTPDNEPRTVALNYHLLDDNETIIFHGSNAGEKIDNIRQNAHVSFFVVGEEKMEADQYDTAFRSVSAQGTAEILIGDEAFPYLVKMTQGLGALKSENEIHDYTYPSWIGKIAIILLHIKDLKGKRRYIGE